MFSIECAVNRAVKPGGAGPGLRDWIFSQLNRIIFGLEPRVENCLENITIFVLTHSFIAIYVFVLKLED